MADDLKAQLQATIQEAFAHNRELSAEKVAWPIVDVIWPEIVKLKGQILEYEHALEHVADRTTHENYNMVFCEDCARLAQSALDGVNRADFEEIAGG